LRRNWSYPGYITYSMKELKSCQQEAIFPKFTGTAQDDSACGRKLVRVNSLDSGFWSMDDAAAGEESADRVSLADILEPSVTWPDTDSDCDNSEDPCESSPMSHVCENSPATPLTPQHLGATPCSNLSGSPSSSMTQAADFSQVFQKQEYQKQEYYEPSVSQANWNSTSRSNALNLEALLPICERTGTTSCSDLCSMQSGGTPTHEVNPGPVLLGRTKVGAQLQKIDGVDCKKPGPILRGHHQVELCQRKMLCGIEDTLPDQRIGHELQPNHMQRLDLASCIDKSAVPVPNIHEEQPQEVTTMMIRNLPRNLTQAALIDALDNSGFSGLYDFCYMPCSFDNSQNKGFAFVNMTSPAAAGMLVGSWHSRRLFAAADGIRSPLSLCPAIVQGREANIEKWNQPRCKRIRNPKLRPFVTEPSACEY